MKKNKHNAGMIDISKFALHRTLLAIRMLCYLPECSLKVTPRDAKLILILQILACNLMIN